MAGEVCRAFETASKEPPEQLKKIWEDYKAQMAAEGKTVHMGGCGFSGSGYKYDQVLSMSLLSIVPLVSGVLFIIGTGRRVTV